MKYFCIYICQAEQLDSASMELNGSTAPVVDFSPEAVGMANILSTSAWIQQPAKMSLVTFPLATCS